MGEIYYECLHDESVQHEDMMKSIVNALEHGTVDVFTAENEVSGVNVKVTVMPIDIVLSEMNLTNTRYPAMELLSKYPIGTGYSVIRWLHSILRYIKRFEPVDETYVYQSEKTFNVYYTFHRTGHEMVVEFKFDIT